jgi:hypothetical protein
MKGSAGQKHILLTNYLADSAAEIDLHACEWKLPDSIEDADITFAGKRLSTIDEEGQREASQASDLVSITYKIRLSNSPGGYLLGFVYQTKDGM